MSSLYGILAVNKAVIHKLPTYAVIAFGVIIAIAFLVGFVKGFRKVAWGGFYWLLAGVGYVFAYKFLAAKNPIAGMFKGKLEGMGGFAWAFLLAIGCVLAALIVYGIFGAIFRPREVLAKEIDEEMDELGYVYEEELEDDTWHADEEIIVIKGGGKPKFFGRLAGGFMCAVNAAAVLAVITAVFLLVVSATALSRGFMGYLFDVPVTRMALKYASTYALDFFTIGIIMAIAYKGYKTGFVGTARAITATIGVLAVVVIFLVIPFTKLSSFHFFNRLIERCDGLYTRVKAPYRAVFAKLTAGVLMAVAAAVIMLLINFLLKKATEGVEDGKVIRVIDGIFAALVYLVIGAAVVALFWGVLYILDYCGVFYASDAFNENASLSKEFFAVAEKFLKGFADKYLLKFRK